MSEKWGTVRYITPHNMTQDAAKATVDNLAPELMRQFGETVSNPRYAWRGYLMDFSGQRAIFNIRGTLQVTDAELVLDVEGIPFLLMGRTQALLQQWFDKNWPG